MGGGGKGGGGGWEKLTDEEMAMLDKEKRSEVKTLQRHLKSAMSKGDLSEQSKLCNTLGVILSEASLPLLSLRFHRLDLATSERTGRRLEVGVAHRKVGEVLAELGEFEEAVSHQERYLSISQELGDKVEEQRAHATLGRTHYCWLAATEDPTHRTSAAAHYHDAMRLTERLRTERALDEGELGEMRASLHLNIGLLYDKVRPDLSERYLNKVLEGAARSRGGLHKRLGLQARLHLAESHLQRGELTDALSHAQQAVKSGIEQDRSLEMLAVVQLHLDRVQEAGTNAKAALKKNMDLENAGRVYKVSRLIAKTKQIDFGSGLRELGILEKMTRLLMALSLHSKAIPWLQRELKMRGELETGGNHTTHERLGACYKESGDASLSLYHYQQHTLLSPSAQGWVNVALLSLQKGEPLQDCRDAVELGYAEATTVQERVMCLRAMVQIAEHFGEVKLGEEASAEVERIGGEEGESAGESQQTLPASDVEISESEGEEDEEEEESREEARTRKSKRGTVAKWKVNEKGETPLHQACAKGSVEKVRELLAKHATPRTRDNAGWTPLHDAVQHGHHEIVQLLVEAGADVNDRGGEACDGITPLHDAAQWGFIGIVKFLVSRGANVLAKDEEGRTPLQLVENLLREDEEGEEWEEGRREAAAYLRETKANPPKVRPPPLSDLFTTGESSTQDYGRGELERFARRSESAVTVGSSSSTQQSRKKNRPTSEPSSKRGRLIDSWLVDDETPSPKRRLPKDPLSGGGMRSRTQPPSPPPSPPLAPVQQQLRVITQPPPPPPAPAPPTSAICVKVKVQGMIFLIPVLANQTISDVVAGVAQRYAAKRGHTPSLTLTTTDGAELCGEDGACLLLREGTEYCAVVEGGEEGGTVAKYRALCKRAGSEPLSTLTPSTLAIPRAKATPLQLELLFTAVYGSTSITSLDLSFNYLPPVNKAVITSLPSLTSLNLACCGLPTIPDFTPLTLLRSLNINQNRFKDFHGICETLVSLPSLETFGARCCGLENALPVSPDMSDKIASLSLTSLDLSQNHIREFPSLPSQLKSLSLGGAPLSTTLRLPPSLTTLSLEDCEITDSNYRDILSPLRSLTSLSLAFNSLSDDSITELYMQHPHLSSLDLTANRGITTETLHTLTLLTPSRVVLRNTSLSDLDSETLTSLVSSLDYCDLSYSGVDLPRIRAAVAASEGRVECTGHRLVIRSP